MQIVALGLNSINQHLQFGIGHKGWSLIVSLNILLYYQLFLLASLEFGVNQHSNPFEEPLPSVISTSLYVGAKPSIFINSYCKPN